MKKYLSLFLALMLVFSVCTVFAVAEGEEEADPEPVVEPEAYLWMTADGTYTPGLTFGIEGLENKDYKIRANVYFSEDCTGDSIYVNFYSYWDKTKYNDFNYLIDYCDFAKHSSEDVTLGAWNWLDFTFNPYKATYAEGNANSVIDDITGGYTAKCEIVTIGMGFWNATGTVKVSSVFVSEADGGNVIWSKGFSTGLDLESEDIYTYILDADKEGTNWGVVRPEIEDNGNIARDAEFTYPTGFGAYTAVLNDGVAYTQASYSADWFAFYRNNAAADNATVQTVEGTDYNCGDVIIDFGETKSWKEVRVNTWNAGGASGIASPALLYVSYSDDGENWTAAGDLLIGEETVSWASKQFPSTIESQYIKVQCCWNIGGGVFLMLNEIEVIGDDIIDVEPSSEVEEPSSEVEEPSSEPEEDDEPYDFASTAKDIKINEAIVGEAVRIFTTTEAAQAGNTTWSINMVLKKVGNGLYEVKEKFSGAFAGTLGTDEIILAVHSSSSNMDDVATYQNVAGKLAAIALEVGDKLDIVGIEAGTITTLAGHTEGQNPPPTGDAGFVALAVVSAIALAGAVVVKKRS